MGQKNQHGFALPVAVFALVVIGVITTGGFFMARHEGRIGVASEHASLVFYLTEQGLVDRINDWDPDLFRGLPFWGDTTFTENYAGIGTVETRITRMTDLLYFVEADGTITRGGLMSGASRRVGVTLRLRVANINPPAAVTTRGETTLGGTAEVHGEDEVPPGWLGVCTGSLSDKPGILIDDEDLVELNGGAEITGSPAVAEDPSITDTTFTNFGDLRWDELTDMADLKLAGGTFSTLEPDSTVDGTCLGGQGNPTNWGNPENPGAACFEWYPIIHISGNARIQSGGVGQGVLLVDGDLDLRGDFLFHGIIIVQGTLETQGNGNRIYGGVMASNASFESQSFSGGSVVTNSTCAVSRAIRNNAGLTRVRPLASRSWVDLSAISGT